MAGQCFACKASFERYPWAKLPLGACLICRRQAEKHGHATYDQRDEEDHDPLPQGFSAEIQSRRVVVTGGGKRLLWFFRGPRPSAEVLSNINRSCNAISARMAT
jgi:hypothetical protein